MTSISPPKITSLPAGTPSGEWADKTESMLQSDTIITDPAMKTTPKAEEHPITTTTNVNTPGHEFPGSYPKELESEEQEQREPRVGNGSEGPPMASVVHAARQHMPDNVERTVEYAGQRAAAYLPIPQGIKDTVNSYWSYDQEGTHPGQQLSTSLPSSEAKGAQPFEHVGGVGSLPGTLSESSVALLPDERATRTPVSKDESRTQPEGDNQAKSAASPAGAAAAAGKTEVSTNLPLHFLVCFRVTASYGARWLLVDISMNPRRCHE
ncbi:hypothetical protein K503DRAFT_231918 [Rhizopogon vinicolor AM-OR11-026]|uniref:Uncharacterized protein n=1 Tax=Rhizopogon vinicolor AM-OR11-026 TaxID=1314800 RepID=A0A1B7MXZ3_9AGAM|nr:hypothetical protein K503DRAFT_231918 [Rhizopogon vinicolor AM-OR11-026]